MRLATEPAAVPIYIASLSPGMLRLTGEVADGWLGTSFVPEGAAAYFDPLRAGASSAGRTLADLDICQGAEVAFAADESVLAGMVAARKKELAFSLGGMGSASTNFYNDAYSRQGWADVAAEVRTLWQAGSRDDAASLGDGRDGARHDVDRHRGDGAGAGSACGAMPGSRRFGCIRPARRSTPSSRRWGGRSSWCVVSKSEFVRWLCFSKTQRRGRI